MTEVTTELRYKMVEKMVYEEGFERGYNIASWQDLPEIGTEIPRFMVDGFSGIIENVEDAQEVFISVCFSAEDSNRQFSLFEFMAKELNALDEVASFDVWGVFEDGITDGFYANWDSRKDYYNE